MPYTESATSAVKKASFKFSLLAVVTDANLGYISQTVKWQCGIGPQGFYFRERGMNRLGAVFDMVAQVRKKWDFSPK